MLPIVDTHQHLWNRSQFSLPWLDGEGMDPLQHDFMMSDYLAAGTGAGIAKTVYMEVDVMPSQRPEEAEFVIGLSRAEDNPMVGAVIGGSPGEQGFRAYIDRFKDNDFITGCAWCCTCPRPSRGAVCRRPLYATYNTWAKWA